MREDEAKKIIIDSFNSEFKEDNFLIFIRNLLKKYTPSKFEPQVKDAFAPFISKYKVIGHFEDNEGNKIDILEVALNKSSTLERARTAQRNFVADYLETNSKEAALVAFVSPDNKDWRLSLVKLEHSLEVKDDKLKTKKEITPAKRWSFLVGENEGSHTAQSRFIDLLISDEDPNLKKLGEAFDIERVTKEFFTKYTELYHQLNEQLNSLLEKDEAIKKDFEEKEISTVDFAKKTLGQIVFLYFLQKKGWFGVRAGEEWGKGNKNFMRRLFDWRKEFSDYKDNFFNDILEPLFYEGLSSDLGADNIYDRLSFKGQKYKMPFLNGGLFSPMFEYSWKTTEIKIPDKLFSNSNKTKEGDVGDGIFDVFNRYNFTVNENEPLEKEVAVDPEMLGKVFENLLDIKDRKSKGAFYTPREIVHYMCQESLINYLETETKNEIPREDLEFFIHKGDRIIENDKIALVKLKAKEIKEKKYECKIINKDTYNLFLPNSIRSKADVLDKLLMNIKVADPAVGSGAFPLGMIKEIVRARKVLHIYLDKKISDYELKFHTISHSIHGVDIDPGAVEIAKLRLWLSLVVEETEPHPLPNLEHKIMQGNSLISEYEGIKLFDESIFEKEKKEGKKQLALGLGKTSSELKMEALQHKTEEFIFESQRTKKQRLKEEIDNLKWELIEATLKEQDKLDKLEEIKKFRKKNIRPFFIWKLEFSDVFMEKGGFDVVIGNPPYVRPHKISSEMKEALWRYYRPVFEAKSDLYACFIQKSIELLHTKGVMSFIVSRTWLSLESFEELRKYILHKSNVKLLSIPPKKTFANATVETIVVLLERQSMVSEHLNNKIKVTKFDGKQFVFEKNILQNLFQNTHLHAFDLSLDDFTIKLKQKMQKITKPLRDCITFFYGLKTGDDSKFIHTEQTTSSHKKMLRRSDFSRYCTHWGREFVWYVPDKMREHKSTARPGDSARFEQPKILVQDIGKNIVATLDNEGFYIKDALLLLATPTGFNLKYILGVLNSKFIRYYYSKTFENLSVAKNAILTLPIRIQDDSCPESKALYIKIPTIVDQILAITSVPDYDPKNPPAKQKELEKQIDDMVYKLYGLTEEEIKIVEGN